jgi:dienelactone hydrolase
VEDLFARDPGEPLDLLVRPAPPPARVPGARALRLELTSRGDTVPGRLLLPPTGEAPFPVVLLQHGAGGSKESEYLELASAPWLAAGAAIASIDFPLHGERLGTKLAAQLVPGRGDAGLRAAFARQAVIDLRRTVDALERLPELDPARLAYAGFSLGALLGAVFCACDPRPRAAALALGGGGLFPAPVDALSHVARVAPRPLLFVNATRDETIPRAAAEALHAAAGEPKQVVWFDATHTELPGVALKAMWTFLAGQLGIARPGARGAAATPPAGAPA